MTAAPQRGRRLGVDAAIDRISLRLIYGGAAERVLRHLEHPDHRYQLDAGRATYLSIRKAKGRRPASDVADSINRLLRDGILQGEPRDTGLWRVSEVRVSAIRRHPALGVPAVGVQVEIRRAVWATMLGVGDTPKGRVLRLHVSGGVGARIHEWSLLHWCRMAARQVEEKTWRPRPVDVGTLLCTSTTRDAKCDLRLGHKGLHHGTRRSGTVKEWPA